MAPPVLSSATRRATRRRRSRRTRAARRSRRRRTRACALGAAMPPSPGRHGDSASPYRETIAAAGREHAVRLQQEARDVVGPEVLDHLAGEDEVHGARLDGAQVAERRGHPFGVVGQVVLRLGRERLDTDVAFRGAARPVVGEPVQVPARVRATAQHHAGARRQPLELLGPQPVQELREVLIAHMALHRRSRAVFYSGRSVRPPSAHPRHRRRRVRRREPLRRAGRAPSRTGVGLRQPQAPRVRAQPAAPARGGRALRARRRALGRATCSALEPSRGDRRVLGRAVRARRRARLARLSRAVQPLRRLTTASSWRAATARSSSSSRPAASIRSAPLERSRTRRRRRASSWTPSSRSGRSAAGIAEDFPLEGARTLYGATKLAAELLITEYARRFGHPDRDRSLRRDRRPVADGQGRPGRLHPLGARAPDSAAPLATSATAAAASRCAT